MDRKGFDTTWLENLKARCNIVSTISKYIRLEKKGQKYWACCPFHQEKTPSFCVNEYEQFYHCFGCKESGDVITFVQKYESLDFYDAVTSLAESVGMEVPAFKEDEEVFKLKQKKQTEKEILSLTCLRYQENLKTPSAKTAQEYLAKRGISQESIQNFGIGYSKSWNDLVSFLKSKGYSIKAMQDAGVVEIKNNDYAYDVMGERLVFPIYNANEEVIGFSGRILVNSETQAKYKNTAQTLNFNKSKAIFGINLIKRQKQQGNLKRILIVEGQIDVVSLHQAGFTEVVACLGTALTVGHARELKRFSDQVILCFDGDEAGIKATLRSIEVLKEQGFNIKVCMLPEKIDPDEFIKMQGKEKFEQLLQSALSYIDYQLTISAKNVDFSKPFERSQYIKKAFEILNQLETFSEKQPYLETIKKISGIPMDVLTRDLSLSQTVQNKKEEKPVQVEQTYSDRESASYKAIKFILASILYKKDYATVNFPIEKFLKNPIHKKLYEYIKSQNELGKTLTIGNLYNVFDVDNEIALQDIIYYNFDEIGNNAKQYYDECVWLFCEEFLKEKQAKLNEAFNNASTNEERKLILQELSSVLKQLKNKKMEEVL